MITLLIVAAAVAWLLWPAGKALPSLPAASDLFPAAAPADPPAPPTVPADARAAIDSLLAVRDRLAAVGPLAPESVAAIDTLWLDLLHGSAAR